MLNALNVDFIDYSKEADIFSTFHITRASAAPLTQPSTPIIFSVAYETREQFYALCPAGTSVETVHQVFPKTHYIIHSVPIDQIPLRFHLTLLINRLSNASLAFNNFTPFLFLPFKKKTKQVVALKYSVDDSLVFSGRVCTFTVVNKATLKQFDQKIVKKIDDHSISQFICRDDYLVRANDKNYEGKFIQKSLSAKHKNTLKHLSINMTEQTKVSEMFKVLRKLNNEYYEFVKLTFTPVTFERLPVSKRSQNIIKLLEEKHGSPFHLNVIDYCSSNAEISEVLRDANVSFCFSDSPDPIAFNLAVVHPKNYYMNPDEDPYSTDKTVNIQHISIDSLNKTTLVQCLLELIMKRDLLSKTISISDLEGHWTFYQFINKVPYVLEIIDNKVFGLSPFDIPNQIHELFERHKSKSPHIIDHDGNVLTILNTDLRLIPDWYCFQNSKKNKTARKYRDDLIGESIDINTFQFNGHTYYSIGEIGYGMQASIANSPATKEIIEEGLHIDELRPMLEPNIIHINKYAVYPYPFKLMNELFILQGGIIDDGTSN